jgi:recombinational DNA repair protein RecT
MEATPIIGYKGLVEMAYRNPKVRSIRIQSVYENDQFDYEYGTNEYIKHKPTMVGARGNLTAVYAIAKIDGIEPLFVVVHKPELDRIQKLSKSGGSQYSPYNNGTDVFNVMQSKVAIKLLFKTLPKTDNEALLKVLELDNKFDYGKNVKIVGEETGYDVIEEEQKVNALEEKPMEEIKVQTTEAYKELNKNGKVS